MDVNTHIAQRLKSLREARGLTLAALAERSGVGRSTISLIERGESSATATVLDKLCAALEVTLASLFERSEDSGIPSPLARAAEQVSWLDPASGYQRRNLSPPAWSPLQLVEVNFPPGQTVAYDNFARETDVYQQVWLLEGSMEISVGETRWLLAPGDCLAMRLDQPTRFHNPGTLPARYLVALSNPRKNP